MRRIVVTGLGLVTPLGNDQERFFRNLVSGVSGIRRLPQALEERLSTKIAAWIDFNAADHFSKLEISRLDRVSQFSMVAADQAIADAGYAATEEARLRTGVYFGTGFGGTQAVDDAYARLYRDGLDSVSPNVVVMTMNNASASHIAMKHGFRGPSNTFSVACASSAIAIGEAFRMIRHGYADAILTGGAEAPLTYGSMRTWEAMRVMARETAPDAGASCRPFSQDRTGFALGEGAAMLMLEEFEAASARGARIYGEVVGYGLACDASHLTRPDADGQARAMVLAMQEAQVLPKDIGYINAHGTATQAGDLAETESIKRIFGTDAKKVAISSTKSMHGHLLGGAGALEFVVSLLALKHGVIPPTAHLAEPDPACDLDYVPLTAREHPQMTHVQSNSFAFGGTNCVLIARKI